MKVSLQMDVVSRPVGSFGGGESLVRRVHCPLQPFMRRVGRGTHSRGMGDVVAGSALEKGFVVDVGNEEVVHTMGGGNS
jgi:hypothetical protein